MHLQNKLLKAMGTAVNPAVTKTEPKDNGSGLPFTKELSLPKNASRPTLKVVFTCTLSIFENARFGIGRKRTFDLS